MAGPRCTGQAPRRDDAERRRRRRARRAGGGGEVSGAGAWDPFELAIRAIVGQQVSVAGARTIAGRIVARAGDRLPSPSGSVVALFPTPDQLAAADLSAIGMPGARARAIVGFASAVAADPGLLAPSDDLDAIVRRLKALPGIGEWTAQYVALRGLKHPDAFPASDLGILRALAGPRRTPPNPGRGAGAGRGLAPISAPTPPNTSGPPMPPNDAEPAAPDPESGIGVRVPVNGLLGQHS